MIKSNVEINKNFFLKPTTKFNTNTQNKSSKNVDIEAKVQREQIKCIHIYKFHLKWLTL